MVDKSSMNVKGQPAAPETLVMKFGGTSVGSPEAMEQVVEIVRNCRPEWPRLVVVTSALSGVTNMLLESAAAAEKGEIESIAPTQVKLREIHWMILEQLIQDSSRRKNVLAQVEHLLDEFTSLCNAIGVLGEATPRALDAVASLGERMSVRVLAAVLEEANIPAQPVEASGLIVTDDCYQDAHPDLEATLVRTRRVLEPVLNQGSVPVVTGFIASNKHGAITTLGRGGSDYSAGILGAVLPADDVWIWTDVDGIMSADPRVVPQARTISELTYREIAELAYYGAKVLHPKTIRPVIEAGIGLRICNTFNPSHPGTRLVEDSLSRENGEIKAVTAIQDQRLITIEGRGMLGVPGVAARAFSAVASTGTSVPLITQASSEQSICFAVPSGSASYVVAALEQAFTIELSRRDIDRIWASNEVVIVTVVGAGMIHTPGIAGRVFSALGAQRVNVIAIAQGSSEVSISLVVDANDAGAALRTLHELIVPKMTTD
jgi:aspartokinase/homoserine dehydrogenase 1